MATVHKGASIVPSKLELVTAWMPDQRWYAAKGRAPQLERVGGFRFEDPEGQVGVEVILVADRAASPPVVYQVPLSYRGAPLEGAEHALIGTMDHSVLGPRWVYDGPHDPVYVAGLVDTILTGGQSDDGQASQGSNALAVGRPTGLTTGTVTSSRVLTGEQSNTSVICRMGARDGGPAEPLIVKVFRIVQDGENPDVAIQSALTQAGSTRVPAAFGHLSGAWDDPAGSGAEQHGQLAFAQEFIPGVEDAWRVALVAAASGTDFTGRARELGMMTAEIHESLAATLGREDASAEAQEALLRSMRARYAAAVADVPELAVRASDVEALLGRLSSVAWPPLQRIHGDYHLGQVLDVPERGWVALDFEGEPLRPLAERVRPDLVHRDIAGMLRSFDYVAGSVRLSGRASTDDTTDAPSAWAARCRLAFVDGYGSVAGELDADDRTLVRVLELDKALYEVDYEARNRPTWLPIPVEAVGRILSEKGPTR